MTTDDLVVAQRAAVVAAAREWISTPFHDCCRVKGAGVDCANLLIAVYAAAGLIEEFTPPYYPPQWFLHRDEPLFLQTVERYARRVEVPQSGDMAMFKFGRQAAHGAIWVSEREIIHAYKPAGFVVRSDPMELSDRQHSYWSVF